jgi:hypothetical protein
MYMHGLCDSRMCLGSNQTTCNFRRQMSKKLLFFAPNVMTKRPSARKCTYVGATASNRQAGESAKGFLNHLNNVVFYLNCAQRRRLPARKNSQVNRCLNKKTPRRAFLTDEADITSRSSGRRLCRACGSKNPTHCRTTRKLLPGGPTLWSGLNRSSTTLDCG